MQPCTKQRGTDKCVSWLLWQQTGDNSHIKALSLLSLTHLLCFYVFIYFTSFKFLLFSLTILHALFFRFFFPYGYCGPLFAPHAIISTLLSSSPPLLISAITQFSCAFPFQTLSPCITSVFPLGVPAAYLLALISAWGGGAFGVEDIWWNIVL